MRPLLARLVAHVRWADARTAALAFTSVAGLALAAVLGTPQPAATYPVGAPAGYAGDQSDGGVVRTCTECHGSYALNSGTGGVSVSVPSVVNPGQTVAVTVTVNNTTTPAAGSVTRQGFEAVARGADGAFVGTTTITDATATRLAGDGAAPYVTHRTAGTTRTSWTFDWTAPDAPATVTFYAAGNAANGGDVPDETGNNAAGDYIYTTTRTVQVGSTAADGGPAPMVALAMSAPHPNPVRAGAAVVRLTLAEADLVRVRIVDGRGRTVRRIADGRRVAGESVVTVRTAGLAPGLYFVVAEAGAGRAVQPISVLR
ncbi:MAG TPA: choice-of-anchor V domain-containing protein [Rubricoccaceae bacterium]|jgi:hypothetical protein